MSLRASACGCVAISYKTRQCKTKEDNIMEYNYYVYIITNTNNKVLYTGFTNDLNRRMFEHKNKLIKGFSFKYNLTKLVYYEHTSDSQSAINREKQIKSWSRIKRNKLIESINANWKDLFNDFVN